MHRAGKKPLRQNQRLQGVGLAGAAGRRGFFSPGSTDPTPDTDNIVTDAGLRIITGDGDQIIKRG